MVSKTSEISTGKMKKITVDGKEILIVNLNGNYFGIDDTCTHMGASLSEGTLDGSIITCGWHGAKFDCKNGNLSAFAAKINDLKSYKVIVESDSIFLEL